MEKFERITNRITIEPAQNGFMIRLNEDFSSGVIRPVPYVFETIDNMLDFIKEKFDKNKNE
jgi:hypothetical protein